MEPDTSLQSLEARTLSAELRGDEQVWRQLHALDDDAGSNWSEVMPTACAMAAARRFGQADLRLITVFVRKFLARNPHSEFSAATDSTHPPGWALPCVFGVQFGVWAASVGVAPGSAHADLGAAVRPRRAGAMSRAFLGADLVGLEAERNVLQVQCALVAAERAHGMTTPFALGGR